MDLGAFLGVNSTSALLKQYPFPRVPFSSFCTRCGPSPIPRRLRLVDGEDCSAASSLAVEAPACAGTAACSGPKVLPSLQESHTVIRNTSPGACNFYEAIH